MKRKLALVVVILVLFAFKKKEELAFAYPKHFPQPSYNFENNPLDTSKIQLGRLLFFDPILSKDNSISCASCHSPYNAFAHTDHDLSHGIHDSIGRRNAPALFNLAWQNSFMWDGAINHLDMQALAPITSSIEMAESLEHVIQKINNSNFYKPRIKAAYGDTILTGERLLKTFAQFQLTLVSSNSKYDQVRRKETQFNEQEMRGYQLFLANCNSCHQEPLFSNYSFERNYLPVDSTLNDLGKEEISSNQEDRFKFKVPSLRNLSYSYPYMHDGRFDKLSQILNHYTDSVTQLMFKERAKKPIDLNSKEKIDLIAFLLTLNDKTFVFNPKHQFPKELIQKARN